MAKSLDWRKSINGNGDFELPTYLYSLITDLMKQTLDMGTLLSEDQAKLRAYKEQIKRTFKDRWRLLAEALEYFEMIVPCTCNPTDYCKICGGSRYLLNASLSPDYLREVTSATNVDDPELAEKLQKGLEQALEDIDNWSEAKRRTFGL